MRRLNPTLTAWMTQWLCLVLLFCLKWSCHDAGLIRGQVLTLTSRRPRRSGFPPCMLVRTNYTINLLIHTCMTLLHSLLPVKCNWQVAAPKSYTKQHSGLCCSCSCIAIATLHCFSYNVCSLCTHLSPTDVKSNYDMSAEAVALARLLFWNRPAWHRVAL